jgi:hypothetical protein
MSSPHVIVSAVHEPEESVKNWWKNHSQNLDSFTERLDHNGDIEWYMCEGKFRSTEALQEFSVEASYHSGRGEEVIEIVIDGKNDIRDNRVSGAEDIIKEINNQMASEFTLEVYYWYDGVDRPGGLR